MLPATENCFSADEILCNAECLLGHIGEVRSVLWRKGYSEHAIDQAVTAVYRAAMPYITGRKTCLIENRRAWVFKVAIRTVARAAVREVRCHTLEPALVAATANDCEPVEERFDLRNTLSQLTEPQSDAVQLCFLEGMSQREAARCMGIAVGTLSGHLSAGKKRLAVILAHHEPRGKSS
jgi:DNA-directed RNA polymerase specialized sigma24 family protein